MHVSIIVPRALIKIKGFNEHESEVFDGTYDGLKLSYAINTMATVKIIKTQKKIKKWHLKLHSSKVNFNNGVGPLT